MGQNLLQLMQAVCDEVGIPSPTLIVSSQDQQIRQLLALSNREGREQASAPGGWPQLRGEQSIPLVNGQAAYDFPSDFDSYIPDTMWDRDMRWPVAGPLTPQEWQFVKSGLINAQPWMRFRVMAGQVFFDPTPTSTTAGQTVTIEYLSNAWCQSNGGMPQSAWGADTDTFRLPDDIMVLGVKWRFLAAKRVDYSEEKAAWSDCVEREKARAYVGRTLPLNRLSYTDTLGGFGNIPDGSWPGRV
jgi:hypothetical protein